MMMMNVQDERKRSSANQSRNPNLMELMDSSDVSNLNRSSNSHATIYSANDHTNTGTNDTKITITAGQQETQAVQVLRVLVLLLLLGAAIAVSVMMFLYMKGDEEDAFQQDYLDLANRLVLGFHAHAKLRLQTMDGLATTIATLALTQDQTWPFVTIPHFEALATAARFVVGGAVTLGVYPYVTNETRKEWEAYTTTHTAWLNESYLYQQEFNEFFGRTISDKAPLYPLDSMGTTGTPSSDNDNTTTATAALSATGTRISVFDGPDGITPEIYRYGTEEEDALFVVDDSPGPYYVMWQVSPARASAAIDVNYNYNDPFYAGGYADAFDVVRETRSAIFAQAWNVDDAGYIDENDDFDVRVVPVAAMLYPVFDTIGNFDNRSVVAVIDLDVEFGPLFSSVLPSGSSPLFCVIRNPCGDQEFSYTVTGDKAFYLGAEDMHDGTYDDMVVETLLTDFYQSTQIMEGDSDSNANGNADYNGAEVNKDYCPWTLEVYPTKVMEEAYLTDKPIYYMLAILGTFLFTSTIFILYDRIVESRQRKVMRTATKSHGIVSSLFPEAVQEQLYGQQDQLQQLKAKSAKFSSAHGNIVGQDGDNDDDDEGLFFGKSSRHTRTSATTADAVLASPPIAELYKECTVFFADVAGFTKWSSTRSPTDVFTLLETIYGAFDKLARKMSVFKIETIGYVRMLCFGTMEYAHTRISNLPFSFHLPSSN